MKISGDDAKRLDALVGADGRISAAAYQSVMRRTAAASPAPASGPPARTSKFGAERTDRDGQRFDSLLEADVYDALRAQGALFLRQVPFHLPGGGTYRLDFLQITDPAAVRLIDAKGVLTQLYRTKKRLVEQLYAPLRIDEVTRAALKRGEL